MLDEEFGSSVVRVLKLLAVVVGSPADTVRLFHHAEEEDCVAGYGVSR